MEGARGSLYLGPILLTFFNPTIIHQFWSYSTNLQLINPISKYHKYKVLFYSDLSIHWLGHTNVAFRPDTLSSDEIIDTYVIGLLSSRQWAY